MDPVQTKYAAPVLSSNVLAFDSANTSKGLLIAIASTSGADDVSISDTQGNAWTKIGPYYGLGSGGGQTLSMALFYCLNAKAGANTVTATATGYYVALEIAEYPADSWGLDVYSASGINYPGASANPSVKTNFLSEVLICGVATNMNGWGHLSIDASGGWTVRGAALIGLADKTVSEIGTYLASLSVSWNGGYVLAAFATDQPTLTVALDPPGAAVTGTPYATRGLISGGVPPYTISVSAGALPPGLKVSVLGDPNNAEILITGLPLKPGTYNFTLRAEDNIGGYGTVDGSITVTGADLSCPCGTVTKVELVSHTDFHYSESTFPWMTPQWAYLHFGFPANCCVPLGCLFNFCLNDPNLTDQSTILWTNKVSTTDLTNILTHDFAGNLAAMIGSLSVQGGASAFGGNWEARSGPGDGTYAESNVFSILDVYVVVTYDNGNKLLIRPNSFKTYDGQLNQGTRYGSGLGVQIRQWHLNSLAINTWAVAFYGFPASFASDTCPPDDCAETFDAPFAAACSPSVSGVSGYPVIFSVSAYGGTAPYTFAKSGVWPAWLSLDTATGFISGTLGAVGTYSISVRVTDSVGGDKTVTCSVAVTEKGNGCEPGFTLEKLVVTLRPDRHGPVRGAAQ